MYKYLHSLSTLRRWIESTALPICLYPLLVCCIAPKDARLKSPVADLTGINPVIDTQVARAQIKDSCRALHPQYISTKPCRHARRSTVLNAFHTLKKFSIALSLAIRNHIFVPCCNASGIKLIWFSPAVVIYSVAMNRQGFLDQLAVVLAGRIAVKSD